MANDDHSTAPEGVPPETSPPSSGTGADSDAGIPLTGLDGNYNFADLFEFRDDMPGFAILRPPWTLDMLPFPDADPREEADWDWAWEDPGVQAEFGGLVVAVNNKKVWGSGRTHRQAREDAVKRPGCPPPDKLVFVPVSASTPEPPPGEGRRS